MTSPDRPPAAERIPVIVGTGEITHRTKEPAEGLEPIVLMERALRAAAVDALGAAAGHAALLGAVDSLDIVCEHSWPYRDAVDLLCTRLGIAPAHRCYGTVGGESPVRFIHEAALRIQRGEATVAAIVGAESRYSVESAAKAGVALPWTPRDPDARLVTGRDYLHPLAIAHGLASPVHIYPLYENAAPVAWGQTPRQAQDESAALWSRCSAVAAANPNAWLRRTYTPAEVATVTPENRLIAWPYPKHMVANPLVNMGAGVLLTSLGHARRLGIPESRLVHLWSGAAADEPADPLRRDQYVRCHAQDLVLETVLAQVGGEAARFEMLELYSCFPIVPKMARRTLGLAADAQMTSTGGLSFFGAPLNNYMTHAAAGLVRALRAAPGQAALLYGQGGYLTRHHALVLASTPASAALPDDYPVQSAADARRAAPPEIVTDHVGPATLETHTTTYGRDGRPQYGTVIARNAQGQRLLARVDADDARTLGALTALDRTPVGSTGNVTRGADGLLRWKAGDE